MGSSVVLFAQNRPRRALLNQAFPILLGQLAVMGNGLVDTLMAGQAGPDVLAAMAVGSSIYISLYVGLMGVIIGLTPICSAHFGAGEYRKVGEDAVQGAWLAFAMSCLGMLVLLNPDAIFSLTNTPAPIAEDTRGYLLGIAWGLPAALVFRVFYALNQSISRPQIVVVLQVLMLLLKIPLNIWFMKGGLGIPALGAAGFGWATAVTMWLVLAISTCIWLFDSHYTEFKSVRSLKPDWVRLGQILRLGLPIGGSYLIEVSSFTVIALLVSRFDVYQLGGHQIVSNMAAMAYMVCLSLGNATTVLVSQQLGAGHSRHAATLVKRGLETAIAVAFCVCLGLYLFDRELISFYTTDMGTIEVAMGLMPWVIAYHFIDAVQTLCSFSLRAYRVSARPMVIYLVSLWFVGIGGGMWLGVWKTNPLKSEGFWMASVAGLLLAGVCLGLLLAHVMRKRNSLETADGIKLTAQPGAVSPQAAQ
ncbi:MAG TPA: MATE family efflux transporter [Limnobacter sp.]|nr:MATE family efflux transporter [Limnobacter sp.]